MKGAVDELDAILQRYSQYLSGVACLCGLAVHRDSIAFCETKRLRTRYHATFLGRTRYSMQYNNLNAKTAPIERWRYPALPGWSAVSSQR